jgi:hypothetical protein
MRTWEDQRAYSEGLVFAALHHPRRILGESIGGMISFCLKLSPYTHL